jgi:hypothetical protein
MRSFITLMIVACLFVVSAYALPTHAKIRQRDLNRRVVVTERAALLQQTDTVSLYLSSEKVALAPRLTKGGIVDVESTVLDRGLIANRHDMKAYVLRLAKTFISVLEERLPTYAPSVARKFNSRTDITFSVNEGTSTRSIAILSGGIWTWSAGMTPVALSNESKVNKVKALESEQKGCNCPARR